MREEPNHSLQLDEWVAIFNLPVLDDIRTTVTGLRIPPLRPAGHSLRASAARLVAFPVFMNTCCAQGYAAAIVSIARHLGDNHPGILSEYEIRSPRLSEVAASTPSGNTAVYDAMCMHMVMAWTLVETFTVDVWSLCVDLCPELGLRAAGGTPEKPDDDDPKFFITFKQLQQYGSDPFYSLGSILKDKWNWSNWERAKEAYQKTFGNETHNASILPLMKRQDVSYLKAIRNAIVHRGAVADKEFLNSARKCGRPSVVAESELVPLTGPLCTELVGACLQYCNDLILFADEHLYGKYPDGKSDPDTD